MRTFGLVFKNAGFLFVSDIITRLLSFALFLVIARVLGQNGLGNYSFIFAFTGLFFVLNDFGISTLFLREASRDLNRVESYFKNFLTMKLFFCFLAAMVTVTAINFAQVSGQLRLAVYFVALATFFLCFKDSFLTVFQIRQQMFFIGLSKVIETFLIVSLGIYALNSGHGLIGLTLAFLTSYFLVFLMSAFACARLIKIRFGFDLNFQKNVLKNSWPFLFTGLFLSISFRTDTVMIQLLRSAEETGLYASSYRLMEALYFVPIAVISAIFPAMSRLHKVDKKLLKRLYRKAFYYLLVIALPMGVGTTLLAERLMLFIYGNEFLVSGVGLQILIWAGVATFLYSIIGYFLNAINKQLLFTLTAAGAALLNVAMNIPLISEFGYIGAAIATVATAYFILLALLYFAGNSGYSLDVIRLSIKPFIAVAVMTLVLLALQDLHVLLIVPVAAVTYFAVLIVVKGVEKEELFLVRKYLKRFV